MIVPIHITELDIAQGIAGSCMNCPIALGIDRVTLWHVNVIGTGFWILNRPGLITLPHIAREFISRFDSIATRDSVRPFSFELDIEDRYLKAEVVKDIIRKKYPERMNRYA